MFPSVSPTRFIGLDIHKHYLVALGVNAAKELVFGPHKVRWSEFERWMKKHLTPDDAVIIEMTTNTWEVHDLLVEHVHSVTVVHPPHVKLIVQAQAMTDTKAALALAQLLAAGLLPKIWVPPQAVRDLRALVAQQEKMRRLATLAKNRLQNALHRHHLVAPDGHVFAAKNRVWWENLPLPSAEKAVLCSDLATLDFAEAQKEILEKELGKLAAQDERMPLLVQLPGVGLITAMTILAAIGDIARFQKAKHLVGYAGLYARYHQSGLRYTTGKLVSMGRRDIRWAMVEASIHAARHHPHWKQVYKELEPRLGRNKTLVAIGRKLLIAVWHILTKKEVDRFAVPEKVAATLFQHAYRVGIENLPDGMSAREYARYCMDAMGIGQKLTHFPYGKKQYALPPSKLAEKSQ